MSMQIDGANNALRDGSGNELLAAVAVASAVNQLQVKNAATGNGAELAAVGDDASVDLLLTPKNTGSIRQGGPFHPQTGFTPAHSRASVAGGDANYTLLNTEYNNRHLEFTGALTAQRNRVVPLADGAEWVINNKTTGGFGVQIICASGTGIVVANGKTAIVRCDGTNIVRVTADV